MEQKVKLKRRIATRSLAGNSKHEWMINAEKYTLDEQKEPNQKATVLQLVQVHICMPFTWQLTVTTTTPPSLCPSSSDIL